MRKKHTYKNILFLVISLLVSLFLSRNQYFINLLLNLGTFGYLGILIAGMLFVSTFTVSLGAVMLSILDSTYPVYLLLPLAGIGAVIGDLTIFRLIKLSLASDLTQLYNNLGGSKISHILHTSHFRWTIPVIGALIIASPLPDEIGIGILGIYNLKTSQFLVLSYILNSLGIAALLYLV